MSGAKVTALGHGIGRAESDAAGSFTLDKLAPGTYMLMVSKVGYAGSDYASTPGRKVTVKEGSVEDVSVSLTPTATLEGRVVDEEGHPLAGVTVYARQKSTSAAVPDTSNADGRYRLQGLVPGEQELRLSTPYEVRRKYARRDPESGELWAYPAVCYHSDAETAAAAEMVFAAPGAVQSGLDLRLRTVRVVSLRGRVTNSATREPLAGAQLELAMEANPTADTGYERRTVQADGSFELPLLEPGQYRLLVFYPEDVSGLPYAMPLDVGLRGPADVAVGVPPPTRIAGQVKVPDGVTQPWGALAVTVDPRLRGVRAKEVQVKGDAPFVIEGVAPGPMTFGVRWNGERTATWYVAALTFGTEDAFSKPVTITEGENPPLQIRLGVNAGRIAGRIAGAASEPVRSRVTVRNRNEAFRHWDVFPADQDGSFVVEGLTPGEYDVVLLGSRPAACDSATAKVKVEVGTTANVQLAPCK